MLALGLVEDLVLLLFLETGQLVLADVDLPQLALELAVALQALRRQLAAPGRGLDRAAGLPLVPAVGEAAALGQLLDLGEGRLDPLVPLPELDLPHSGGIDEQPAGGGAEELAVGGGVPAAVVPLADLACTLDLAPEQAVDQGRLADARGAEQPDRLPWAEVGGQPPAVLAGERAHPVDRHAEGDGLGLQQAGLGV